MASSVGRESLAEATEKFVAATADATPVQRTTVADEILSVAALLKTQPRLRRALTDPSRSGSARADLLRSLLTGKASEITVDVLATLAGGRWSRPNRTAPAAASPTSAAARGGNRPLPTERTTS